MQKKLLVIFSVLFLAAACTKQASIPNSGNPEAGAQIVEKNNQAVNLSEWNSYQSPPKYGFSIKYPKDFGFNTDLRKIISPSYIPICDKGIKTVISCVYYTGDLYQGTNFGSAGVEVSIIKGLSAPAECYIFGTAQPQKVLINGVEFVYAEENEGAAGHFSSDKIYRSLKGSDCYQLRARITSANIANYEPGTVKEFNSKSLEEILLAISGSFKFSDGASGTWKTYASQAYGFEFEYPANFTIEDSNSPGVSEYMFRILSSEGDYLGSVNTCPSDFCRPTTQDIKKWVAAHGYAHEQFAGGYYANQPGTVFKIDGLPTLHLLNKTPQAGVYDQFFFIKDGTLFYIDLDPEMSPNQSWEKGKNLDLQDTTKWYNTFLRSFRFAK